MNADDWLASYLAPALERESLAHTTDAAVLRGQLAALHDCGVLDDSTYADARRRLDAVAANPQALAWSGAQHVGSISSDRLAARLALIPPAVHLRHVVPVAQPLAVIEGVDFVVTSVEVWENQVYLMLAGLATTEALERFRQHDADLAEYAHQVRTGTSAGTLSPPMPPSHRLFEVDIRLSDDAGTTYAPMGRGGSGNRTEWRLHRSYAPGVPPHATRLTITVPEVATMDIAI